MGCSCSSLLFLPPEKQCFRFEKPIERIPTRNGTNIEFIYIHQFSEITILYSHCNAEDISSAYEYADRIFISQIPVNIALYEYSGYGETRNTFKPTEQSLYKDIEAAYSHLLTKYKIPPNRIILFGRSIGSGPTTYLGSSNRVGGVILQSAFTSILRIAFDLEYSLFCDVFKNIDYIKKIECPVFIIHGKCDELVSFSHAVQLYKACKYKYPPLFVKQGGHNDVEIYAFIKYLKALRQFISHIKKLSKKES
jgi:fermentation-respiration switch protein FrsA (DUF1100 family)